MAVDTTNTLVLSGTPVEIVATLNLKHGEYRIENASPPRHATSAALIRFLAAASQPDFSGPPDTWGGHALAAGAREDIGIEQGQKWYFWSPDGATLVITASEAGGAIGGSPPVIRHPSFHVDIFRVYPNLASIPSAAPIGGAYTLGTAQLTPPSGWSENQQTLQSGEVEAHSRAIIDPNTTDLVVTPVWSIPQQVALIGTITGVTTTAPLSGSGTAGSVALSVQNRGITNDFLADDSVDLRVLEGGTPGQYLGFDAQGDPAELTPHTMISQLDVPAYEEDKILQIQAGNPTWVDLPRVPRDIEFFYGHTVPSPEGESDIWFVDDNASGVAGVYEHDATTPRTRILKGDVYEWRAITGQVAFQGWVWQANVDSAYGLVTDTTDGIMRSEDKSKLDGIEAGAEENVQADWNITNTNSDAYIHNKPTIPAAQVQADWDESVNTEVDFIKNKPTSITDFDVPSIANNDGRALGLVSGALSWVDLGSFRLSFGTDFPTNPGNGNHFIFTGNVLLGLDDYVDSDGSTPKTSSVIGDVATYDGTNWRFTGSINTQYSSATHNATGLMTGADKAKLDGIQAGAELNVQVDWNETTTTSDSFIKNKPTIPAAQVQSDWNETDSDDVSFIQNKPTVPAAQIQSDWAKTDSTDVDFIKNKPTVPTNIPNAPAAGSADAVYELSVTSAGVYTWTASFVPGVPTITAGGSFPMSPSINDLHFSTAAISTNIPTNIRDADGTTVSTIVNKGDIHKYSTVSGDNVWVLQGNLDTAPALASGNNPGLLSAADFTKLAGIASGAEVNVQSDWNETTTTSDAFIANKPTIPDAQIQADWNQTDTDAVDYIENKPTIPDAQIHSDWAQTDADAVDFIENKPTIPTIPGAATTSTAGLMSSSDKTKLEGIETGAEVNVQSDWNATSGDSFIQNKPNIPASQIQSDWNQSTTSALDFIKNKPSIPAAQIQSDWNQSTTTALDFIKNKPTIPSGQVQSDWAQTDDDAVDFIENKPSFTVANTIPTSANVASFHIMPANITSSIPSNVVDGDSNTLGSISVGDVFRYDGTNWVLQGNIDTHYELADSSNQGLMSAADFLQIGGD